MNGPLIASKRSEKGLTQSQLAELVGVSRKTVVRWERGLVRPTNSHLLRLVAVLDLAPEDLA